MKNIYLDNKNKISFKLSSILKDYKIKFLVLKKNYFFLFYCKFVY